MTVKLPLRWSAVHAAGPGAVEVVALAGEVVEEEPVEEGRLVVDPGKVGNVGMTALWCGLLLQAASGAARTVTIAKRTARPDRMARTYTVGPSDRPPT
jgi:hypothetical protein